LVIVLMQLPLDGWIKMLR